MKGRKLSAFTLVELMIVIGLIALLLAILVPAINTARYHARRIRCMSNLRQLTLAWLTYAHDNRDRLVNANTAPGDWVGSGSTTAALTSGKLYPYVRSTSIYLCPNDTVNYNRTYSISGYLNGQNTTATAGATILPQIIHPGSTFVFIEEYDNRKSNLGSFMVTQYPSTQWVDDPAIWHENAGMVSFADGRAEIWPWVDPRTSQIQGFHYVSQPGNSDLMQLQTWLGWGQCPPGFARY